MNKYPDNTPICLQDFRNSGWESGVLKCEHGYSSIWTALSKLASEKIKDGKMSEGKALWILADACSMIFNTDNFNEPFKPMMVMEGRQSVIATDFSENDIQILSEFCNDVNDKYLKARIADLVWDRKKIRNIQFALTAIEEYCKFPLDYNHWNRGSKECWERAITLSKGIGAPGLRKLLEIETELENVLLSCTIDAGFFGIWIATVLEKNRLGNRKKSEIAKLLEFIGRSADIQGNIDLAKEYYLGASRWYKKCDASDKFLEMILMVAEGWAKEGDAMQTSGNIASVSCYENALQFYRLIPKSSRSLYDVDSKMAVLLQSLQSAGISSIENMFNFLSPPIYITDSIEKSKNLIIGKSAKEAFYIFVNIYSGANYQKLCEFAKDLMIRNPLAFMFGSTHFAKDGRVISKDIGFDLNNPNSESNKKAVYAQAIKIYQTEIEICTQAKIYPAYNVLVAEHKLSENDFIALARQSPIVPKNRSELFGKALYVGYEGNFTSAIHLLVPQIENMVRYHLKNAKVKTTTIDLNGIENENGLSTLAELSETEKIFGENLTFEIKALLCDSRGPNYRNEIAHGLIEIDDCESSISMYVWWLGLKIIYNTFWNRIQKMP